MRSLFMASRNVLRTQVLVEAEDQGDLFDKILSYLDIRCGVRLANSHVLLNETFKVGVFNSFANDPKYGCAIFSGDDKARVDAEAAKWEKAAMGNTATFTIRSSSGQFR